MAGGLDRLADRGEIDDLRLVLDIDRVGTEIGPSRDHTGRHPQGEFDACHARRTMHVLDQETRLGGARAVAGGSDRFCQVAD